MRFESSFYRIATSLKDFCRKKTALRRSRTTLYNVLKGVMCVVAMVILKQQRAVSWFVICLSGNNDVTSK